ncbi:MAG: hypothetical protein U0166_15420 [Acidobacteriota bacterium]
MLGEKLGDISGKVTGTRVVPAGDGIEVETSFQGTGKMLGIDTVEMGTYCSSMGPSGHLYGQGQGLAMTAEGDSLRWRGMGVGKPTGKGAGVSYRYCVSYQTASTKLARLNGVLVVGEWEVDENGNCKGQTWEWK